MSTFTIGEIAERSGFSASALRYYEGIGLVPPATRTASGYRLYGEETLDRLTFIARTKQLGCTLEEITDLVGIWDGERCGPVQKRLHDLVTRLAGPVIDGPCTEQCACLALDAGAAAVTLTSKGAAR